MVMLLCFCALYLPKVISFYVSSEQDGPIARVGRFRYFVNRARRNFSDALNLLAAKHPDYSGDSVFTYFAAFGESEFPKIHGPSSLVKLIDRSITDTYEDKRRLAILLKEKNCEGAFARTFLSATEALEATQEEPSALFFAKLPYETGGKGIEILTREDLTKRDLSPDFIFQRAVQDLELIEERKFVIRYHLLIHNGSLYLHERGILVVHGLPYDPNSTDYGVQVRHNWFEEGSRCRLSLLHESPQAPRWRDAISRRLKEIRPALQQCIAASSADRYTLVGGDALIERTGEARLIELNTHPNLWTDNLLVDTQVYVPVIEDMLAKILLGESPDGFVQVV